MKRKYYSFTQAAEIMSTGQVMGGGSEFDYYFMINGRIYGGFTSDCTLYDINMEREQIEAFYMIKGMTNEWYLDQQAPSVSQLVGSDS